MKSFIVTVREVWTQGIHVEANTEEEALKAIQEGEGETIEALLEYSHTMDPDTWTVEEEEP